MADEFALTNFGLCSYSVAGGAQSAALAIDGRVIALGAFAEHNSELMLLLGAGRVTDLLQHWDRVWPLLQESAASFRGGPDSARLKALSAPIEQVRLHSPVEAPGTIYCAGANYRKHVIDLIKERFLPPGHEQMTREKIHQYAVARVDERSKLAEPYHFIKNPNSLVGPYDDVIVPALAKETDWELELGVVIGRKAWCVSEHEALDYVAGYAVAHDVSTRDRMYRPGAVGADFIQAKGLATFFPFGPYLVPRPFVQDPQKIRIQLKLNGQIMQDESTDDMIASVAQLIAYLSKWVTLYPGDIIATGSPAGNGTHHNRYLKPGDRIEGSLTGLGTQRNLMIAEQRPG